MSNKTWLHKTFLISALIVLLGLIPAVSSIPEPDGGYRFPMSGSSFALAGTFGELRGNHFHSGIDIKTNGGVGMPLVAVRDGYIYRLKVSPYGFGKAIYLRHADGEFSVYGHMNGFTPAIEEFIYQKQYASKQYEQEIYLDEGQMPVKQGELIGYSGNSGYSGGPHLHFEIRDPDERILNPLPYYKAFIQDHKKPELSGVAFEPLGIDSRVNGRFEKLELKVEGSNGEYRVPNTVLLTGPVGLEFDAVDRLDAASNACGINYVRVCLDERPIFEFSLDQFSFDEKRYINLYFDFQHYKRNSRKYQRGYIEAGNHLPSYPKPELDGRIVLQDDRTHVLRLELADGYRNTTNLEVNVRRSMPSPLPTSVTGGNGQSLKSTINRDVCVLRLSKPVTRQLQGLEVVHLDGKKDILLPAYLAGEELIYLLNLRQENSPTFVHDPIAGHKVDFFLKQLAYPDADNLITEGELQVFMPKGCVFDTLPLHIKRRPGGSQCYSDQYEIGRIEQPLFQSFVMSFFPAKQVDRSHLVVARRQGGSWEYVGQELKEDGSVVASSADFGTFCLMADSVGPIITPLNFKPGASIPATQKTISLKVSDAFSGINSQKLLCTIDGKWELFEYDAKSNSIIYRPLNRGAARSHTLQVMAFDNANNLSQAVFNLTY